MTTNRVVDDEISVRSHGEKFRITILVAEVPDGLQPNEVDRLLTQIKNIQSACDHDFKPSKEMIFVKTLVAKVCYLELCSEMNWKCSKCSTEDNNIRCPFCSSRFDGKTYKVDVNEYFISTDRRHSYRWRRVDCGTPGCGFGYLYVPCSI